MLKSVGIRLTACLLVVVLAGSPMPSLAGENQVIKAVGEAGAAMKEAPVPGSIPVSLEKAIRIARDKLPVPAELEKFSSDYNEYNGKALWSLRWYSPQTPESSMHVSINASTGEVENVNLYRHVTPSHYKGLPLHSRDQALKIAREEAFRMQPDNFPNTVLAPREDWPMSSVLKERDYPVIYDFHFRRTSGGIPVSDQGINVGINAETGELIRYDSNWSADAKLPSQEGKVGLDEAKKIFRDKSGFELTYFMTSQPDADTPGELKLVYRLKPPGRFFLNALTGEVIDSRVMDFYFDEMGAGGRGGDFMYSSKKKVEMSLTPAENRAVKETADLISADRAQEIAAKVVELPKGYTVDSRNLQHYYAVPGSRVWNIQFSGSEKKKWFRVSLEARSGELVSFSKDQQYNPEDIYKEPQVKVTAEQAQKTAEELIKKLQPGKFGQVVFRQSEPEIGPWVKMGRNTPGAYNLNFARMVNGVVYPENGFRVRVDSTTGEVTSYQITWLEANFPAVQGIIEKTLANEKFLASHPLTLEYSRGLQRMENGKESDYYLIYRPKEGSGVMLDAVTGQEIDHQGKPVAKKDKSFTDISGHPAEGDIRLLLGEGIIMGNGGLFRPDDPVTGAEFLAMLVKAYSQGGPYIPMAESGKDPWYKPIFDSARARGILDGDLNINPEGSLNRLQLSRLGINAGGWGKLAGFSDIFKLEVYDSASIPVEYRGYAASALAMGLIEPENGSFIPEKVIARGDAATFLVKLLKQ